MLSVWSTDAAVVKDSEEFETVPFHQTSVTRDFLSGGAAHKLFVCGLKGIGKTLLLKKKSSEVRHAQSGVNFLPVDELVEHLNSLVNSMSSSDAKEFSAPTAWSRAWQLVLTVAMLKRLCDIAPGPTFEIPEELRNVFPDAQDFSVSYHIDRLLRVGSHDRRLLVENHLAPVQARLRRLQHGFSVFVDAIDDCVYSHAGQDLQDYTVRKRTQLGVLSTEVWAAAQVGFVQAAVNLHESNKHVKIFGALRKEAFEMPRLPDRQNLETYLLPLEYSRRDLKGIFTTKLTVLRQLEPRYFPSSATMDVVEGFFGFTRISHPVVKDASHEPLSEDVLEYIIRHSRGRPRELDMIGESLQVIEDRPPSPEEVRRKVRDKSRTWFEWAKTEMIPHWRDDYDRLLTRISSNFITRAEKEKLREEYKADTGRDVDPFLDLFELGLVGCPVVSDDGPIQRFRQNDPELPVSKAEFSAASHLVIHPCVNLATRSLKESYRPSPTSVAGHGYPFVERPKLLHVHFGAGALGVGLVIPLLAESRAANICLVQRRTSPGLLKDKWAGFPATGSNCVLARRHRVVEHAMPERTVALEAVVVQDDVSRATFSDYVKQWVAGERSLFVLTDDEQKVMQLLSQATSVSLALRSRDSIRRLAEQILAHAPRVMAVYPFENDEEAVHDMAVLLRGGGREVIKVVADRMCLAAIQDRDGLTVDTEEYFRVVIGDGSPASKRLFGGRRDAHDGEVVFLSDRRRFDFEHEVKRSIVNGLHFAYVVYAFQVVKARFGDDPNLMQLLIENRVSQVFVMSQEVQNALDRVAALYTIHLLVSAESAGVLGATDDIGALYSQLRRQYDSFTTRLTNNRDQLDRILRRDASTIAKTFDRFMEPLKSLPIRMAVTPRTRTYLEDKTWTTQRIGSEVTSYMADCTALFAYLR